MKNIALIILLFSYHQSFAQSPYSSVKKGNSCVKNEKFADAELHYRRALDASPNTPIPKYNLGIAQCAQGQLEASAQQFKESADLFTLASDKAEAYHNMGNALLLQEKYEESIEAYKKALKISPSDMDTKYNLAYAQLMLKKEQEQEQQNQKQNQENQEDQEQDQDQENQDEKDQNQDQGEQKEDEKDGDSEKDKQDEKQDKKEDQGKDPSKQEQETPKEAKLSKEQAEQLLKALESEEAKLQEKLDEPEGEAVKIFIEKDW